MKLDKYKLITAGLVGVTACSGLVLASATSHADNDSATDDVNITVPVACTMTGTIATGQEHTATLAPGTYSGASGSTYENGIGKTTLATFCNDYNGFSIYAIGFTGETEGDNTLVGTSASSGATIPTKVYESTDTTSNWSMKVTKVTDSSATFNPANMSIANSFDSWHTVPDDYTRVAEYHASTSSSATDQSLGAKVETTYAAFISQTQPADTYTGKVKYVMVHPYATDPDPYKPTMAVYMQDVATWKNTLLPNIGDEIIATDARDGKQYYVAKLPDGNIWMTQNLDFEIGSATINNTNTDVPSNWSDTLRNTYATDDTAWEESANIPESYDPGDLCWNGVIDKNWIDLSTSTIACSQHADHYHIGNYYNWTAAVAMEDSSNYDYDETDVNQSICPANWMLPKGGYNRTGSGSFYNLVNDRYTAGISGNIQSSPVYFVYGGYWYGLSGSIGADGYYWSSVVNDSYLSGDLFFNATEYLDPQDFSSRENGRSVRCLVR